MMKIITILPIACAAALFGAATAQEVTQRTNEPPPIVIPPVSDDTGVKQDVELDIVAILTVDFVFDNGKVVSARVIEQETRRSIAPKVFLRAGGAWVVQIKGERDAKFYTTNPGYLEAEPYEKDGYRWVGVSGPVEWRLVVPLSIEGESLGAQSITIHDTENDAVILEHRL